MMKTTRARRGPTRHAALAAARLMPRRRPSCQPVSSRYRACLAPSGGIGPLSSPLESVRVSVSPCLLPGPGGGGGPTSPPNPAASERIKQRTRLSVYRDTAAIPLSNLPPQSPSKCPDHHALSVSPPTALISHRQLCAVGRSARPGEERAPTGGATVASAAPVIGHIPGATDQRQISAV